MDAAAMTRPTLRVVAGGQTSATRRPVIARVAIVVPAGALARYGGSSTVARITTSCASSPGPTGSFFLEIKSSVADARTVTVTRNEILTGLNRPEELILAVALVGSDQACPSVYVHCSLQKEPDFGVTSVNLAIGELLARGEAPA